MRLHLLATIDPCPGISTRIGKDGNKDVGMALSAGGR
jgi:hypothetical protein